MGRCDFCGKEDYLLHTCSVCGKKFCSDHRVPESHGCSKNLNKLLDRHSLKENNDVQTHEETKIGEPVSVRPKEQREYTKSPGTSRNTKFEYISDDRWNITKKLHSVRKRTQIIRGGNKVVTLGIMILISFGSFFLIDYIGSLVKTRVIVITGIEFILGLTILMILVGAHELLHTFAWRYFGYYSKVLIVLPFFGLTQGTKPSRYSENFLISLAPLMLTFAGLALSYNVTKRLDVNSLISTNYGVYALLNLMGMAADFIHALAG